MVIKRLSEEAGVTMVIQLKVLKWYHQNPPQCIAAISHSSPLTQLQKQGVFCQHKLLQLMQPTTGQVGGTITILSGKYFFNIKYQENRSQSSTIANQLAREPGLTITSTGGTHGWRENVHCKQLVQPWVCLPSHRVFPLQRLSALFTLVIPGFLYSGPLEF